MNRPMPSGERVLVAVPTYNEADNVESIFRTLTGLPLPLEFLFIDDNSPDGTGKILDRLAAGMGNVRVMHRPGKMGIGSAHQAGIRYAYEQGYRTLVTMDADLTHSPALIKDFLAAISESDIVVGSRWKHRGSLAGWVWYRHLLTHAAHWMTVALLGMPYDASGAFRAYRLDRIPHATFALVRDTGYSFFWESLFILWMNGHSVREIPIQLPVRAMGQSKMRFRDVIHGVLRLFGMFRRKLFDRKSLILRQQDAEGSRANSAAEWERYWEGKTGKKRSGFYDVIAQFYRLYIIKRTLRHYTRKHFAAHAKLLHAGCGGGEVDDVVVSRNQVTALDISENALNHYRKLHNGNAEIIHGSIYAIGAGPDTFDGIYNLGVMEHFSPEEIGRVLTEFRRVLKPGGRLVLFWPPTYGLSVAALKIIHFVLNRILRKNIRLHPDEPSLIRSKAQAEAYLRGSGLDPIEYSFGIRDLFTYAVVVGEKRPAL